MAQVTGHESGPDWEMGMTREEWSRKNREWLEALSTKLRRVCAQEFVGEVVRLQVADGYAEYMVSSARPLRLVHLDVGDGYEAPAPWLRGLRHEDVAEMIAVERAIARSCGQIRSRIDESQSHHRD